MKLGKKIIAEPVIVGADINPNYLVATTLDTNVYTDITSEANWIIYGLKTGKDYKYCRDQVKTMTKDAAVSAAQGTETDPSLLTPTTGQFWIVGTGAIGDWATQDDKIAEWNGSTWDFYSKEEKGFALSSDPVFLTTHNIGTYTQQKNTVGIEALVLLGQQYSYKAMGARQKRLLAATSEVYNRLFTNKEEVQSDMKNEGLLDTFIQGTEGTQYGDSEGLIDYIKGVAGTKYASGGALPGLEHKGWTPEGMTMTQFTDHLVDVLVNGNY